MYNYRWVDLFICPVPLFTGLFLPFIRANRRPMPMFLLYLLTIITPLSHIRLQNGHFLLIPTILCGQFLHKFINKGILPTDDLIHSHTNLIEPFIQIILICFELIYLGSYFVIFVIDHHQVLLDFAHHVVHCLLLSSELEELLCA